VTLVGSRAHDFFQREALVLDASIAGGTGIPVAAEVSVERKVLASQAIVALVEGALIIVAAIQRLTRMPPPLGSRPVSSSFFFFASFQAASEAAAFSSPPASIFA
jgi:hypothetical protein